MNDHHKNHRVILQEIAHRVMLERGFMPEFSKAAQLELDRIQQPAKTDDPTLRDLRSLLWASIDNDDSLDLDQLTVAEALPDGRVKILVAIADVDGLVAAGSAIDGDAGHNTTSIYTAAQIFPMLPEKLSTNLTSLNGAQDRLSVVIEMVIAPDGTVGDSTIYHAVVRNHAKLAYNSVAAWLESSAAMPDPLAAVTGLADNLKLQDQTAQRMKNLRHTHGALSLQTIEAQPVFDGDMLLDLREDEKNRAKDIIEDFMIAANGVTARYLAAHDFPSIRRVVRVPKRWDRIVEIAQEHGFTLPAQPDQPALEQFLTKALTDDPLRFPDLSLAVIKLLGSGEYIAEQPGANPPGHFGLAVQDYTHSTAPNRRYTDLISQRLVKAVLTGKSVPYSNDELEALATHCTQAEDGANKVERQVGKSAAALLLENRIGEQFDSIVTGASPKGTWVRLIKLPIEGMLVQGFEGLDVGNKVTVKLVKVDVEKGFIDFIRVR
ncbi:MAG: RNB domain-containing ribonuclease [Anaerolineaceae bacterium]